MMKKTPLLAGAFGCLLIGSLAIAQQGPIQPKPLAIASPSASPAGSPSASPAAVIPSGTISQSVELPFALNYLHYTNELQIAQANAALPILTEQSAITLAQTMITDATASEQQVVALATTKGITLVPFQAASYDLAAEDALAQLASPAYDSSFTGLQLQNDLAVLYELQLLTNAVNDPAVLALLNSSITTVQSLIRLAGGTVPPAPPSPFPRPIPITSPSVSPTSSPSASPSV